MKRELEPVVYLMASRRNGTLYIGNLKSAPARRSASWTFAGFTAEYAVNLLVWFEAYETMESAILREKRIKKWRRAWKFDLIEQGNELARTCLRLRFRTV